MSIAEKLTAIAENVPKVYEAGKSSMVDESKIVPKTVSGTSISVDDVSEIPHSVSCKIENINLYQPTKESAELRGVTLTKNDDNSYTVSGTNTSDTTAGFKLGTYYLNSNATLYLSGGSKDLPLYFYGYKDGELVGGTTAYSYTYRVLNPDFDYYEVIILVSAGQTVNATLKPMISFYEHYQGLVDGYYSYTPYVPPESIQVIKYGADESKGYQTLTPNADGTVEGIKSTSPHLNILSDTAGVIFEVTYHKSWGMQWEYDRVWDDFQENGTKTNYHTAFASRGWISGTTYNPKYPIVCSGNNTASNMFGSSYVTDTLVPITISGANASVFYGARIKTIRKLILGSGITTMGDWFTNMASLEDIEIEGEIPVSTKFAQSTKLTAKSLVSIVEHLSASASGKTLTFSATAVNNADWSRIPEYESWDALVAKKKPSGWTISVVDG